MLSVNQVHGLIARTYVSNIGETRCRNRAPYGYRNVRKNGRSVVEICPETGPKVRRVFQLFAYENLTLDSLIERLEREGLTYKPSAPKFA